MELKVIRWPTIIESIGRLAGGQPAQRYFIQHSLDSVLVYHDGIPALLTDDVGSVIWPMMMMDSNR